VALPTLRAAYSAGVSDPAESDIPTGMVTAAFFRLMRSRLTAESEQEDGGVVVVNCADENPRREWQIVVEFAAAFAAHAPSATGADGAAEAEGAGGNSGGGGRRRGLSERRPQQLRLLLQAMHAAGREGGVGFTQELRELAAEAEGAGAARGRGVAQGGRGERSDSHRRFDLDSCASIVVGLAIT